MIETNERVLKLDFENSTKEIIFSSGKLKTVLTEVEQGLKVDKITQYDSAKKLFKKVAKHHLKMLFDYDNEAIALLIKNELI